jgi:hypothetical protein
MSANPHALKLRELPGVTVREVLVVLVSAAAFALAACRVAWSRTRILFRAYWRREYGPFLETTKDVEKLHEQK